MVKQKNAAQIAKIKRFAEKMTKISILFTFSDISLNYYKNFNKNRNI